MGININRDYVSTVNTYAGKNVPKYIVVHETDNFDKGAGAKRHAQAQHDGNLSTSVHYYTGSDGIYQAAEHTDGTYSIGKEYGGDHSIKDADNRNSINIEICVNPDGDYSVARANAIALVKYLIQTTGIPAERVIRHFDAKGKYCPRKMMDTPDLWGDFKAQISTKEVEKEYKMETLKLGSKGNDVTIFESIMKKMGYYNGEIDTTFGPQCLAACNAFQTDHPECGTDGKPDNTFGPMCWKKSLSILSA